MRLLPEIRVTRSVVIGGRSGSALLGRGTALAASGNGRGKRIDGAPPPARPI